METKTSTKRMYRSSMSGQYARALYELRVPKTEIEKTKEIFAEVPKLREVLVNPTIAAKRKMSIINQVFPEDMKNFVKVICKNQRMNLIDEIFDAYDEYCDVQEHILTAVLTCVEPPSEEQLEKMKVFLCDKYQKADVKIQIVEDASLLGGFILRAENDEYDWSLKGRLTRLEQKLTWR